MSFVKQRKNKIVFMCIIIITEHVKIYFNIIFNNIALLN